MLFILHNSVVLSLFLCIFYYIFYTVFYTVYTYFLYILYTFYTYFVHFFAIFCHFLPFLRKNNALLVHYWLNITHFRVFFPSISYNFLYIYTNIVRTSPHTRAVFRFASFFIFCTFVQTFSTHCTKLYLRARSFLAHLHKLLPACRRTFSSLWETL